MSLPLLATVGLSCAVAGGVAALSSLRRRDTRDDDAEYTRLLAEHGLFGVLAMGCLLAMVWVGFRRQRQPFGQAWTAALVAWTALELSHSSTRLAAVAFTFALAQFAVIDRPSSPEATATDGVQEVRP